MRQKGGNSHQDQWRGEGQRCEDGAVPQVCQSVHSKPIVWQMKQYRSAISSICKENTKSIIWLADSEDNHLPFLPQSIKGQLLSTLHFHGQRPEQDTGNSKGLSFHHWWYDSVWVLPSVSLLHKAAILTRLICYGPSFMVPKTGLSTCNFQRCSIFTHVFVSIHVCTHMQT